MVSCTQTKRAVQDIQQAFGSLLSGFNFTFVISNPREPDNPVVYASSSFFELTGYPPSEVLGRNCRFLQGPETSHQSILEIRDAIREDRPCSVCLINYKKDGTKFWNAFHLEPIRSEDTGCVDFYVGTQADVTQLMERGGTACVAAVVGEEETHAGQIRRQLREHRQEWQPAESTCAADARVPSSMLCAITKIQDCFVLADPNLPDCPIVYASPSFLEMTGYTSHEVLGRNCRFLQGPGTDRQQVAQLSAALCSTPPRAATVTMLNYRKDGTPFWNCLHVAPVRDAAGSVQFFAGVQLDITAHHDPSQAPPTAAGGATAEPPLADGPVHQVAAGTEGPGAAASGQRAGQAPQRTQQGAGEVEGSTATDAAAAAAEEAVPALNEPSPWLLLQQKGVVGAVRVATRALSQHGLRRERAFQQPPRHVIDS